MKTLAVVPAALMAAVAMGCLLAQSVTAQTTAPTTQPAITMEQWKAMAWDTSHAGRELDLSQYQRTFNDDFKTMDIVKEDAAPSSEATWFSPGHGAYREQCPLRKDGPFTLVDEGLRCRVEKVGKRWLGANMTSVNTRGQGFAQQYGYFEMTARYDYPAGTKVLWGGFWLKSQRDYFDNAATRVEIDANEFYGDDGYHPSVHLWPAAKLAPDAPITKHVSHSGFKEKVGRNVFKDVKVDGVVQGFHRYGVEITPESVIAYFDGKELGRFPTVEEFKTPLYMLVTNDSRKIKPGEEPKTPMDLVVKNVAAYQPTTPYAGR